MSTPHQVMPTDSPRNYSLPFIFLTGHPPASTQPKITLLSKKFKIDFVFSGPAYNVHTWKLTNKRSSKSSPAHAPFSKVTSSSARASIAPIISNALRSASASMPSLDSRSFYSPRPARSASNLIPCWPPPWAASSSAKNSLAKPTFAIFSQKKKITHSCCAAVSPSPRRKRFSSSKTSSPAAVAYSRASLS